MLPGNFSVNEKVCRKQNVWHAVESIEHSDDETQNVAINEEGVVQGSGDELGYLEVTFSGTKTWDVEPSDICKVKQVCQRGGSGSRARRRVGTKAWTFNWTSNQANVSDISKVSIEFMKLIELVFAPEV